MYTHIYSYILYQLIIAVHYLPPLVRKMSLCSILELKILTQNWLAYWRHGNIILSDFLFYEMAPLHLLIFILGFGTKIEDWA